MDAKDVSSKLQELLKFYNNKPPLALIAETLGTNEEVAESLLKEELANRKAIKQRKPRVKKPPIDIKPVEIPKPIPKPKVDNTVLFIRIVMGIVSIPALVLSAYFSIIWLGEQLPFLVALSMGIVLISFGTMAFELSIFFFRDKNKMYIVFFIAWIALTGFNITNTVASLYNTYLYNVSVKESNKSQDTANANIYTRMLDNEKAKKEEKIQVEFRMKSAMNVVNELDTLEKQAENRTRYNEALQRIVVAEKEIKKINDELNKISIDISSYLKDNTKVVKVENNKNVFDFIGGIFKVEAEYIQFVMLVIPAIILDIIASLSLYVCLFMKKKEE